MPQFALLFEHSECCTQICAVHPSLHRQTELCGITNASLWSLVVVAKRYRAHVVTQSEELIAPFDPHIHWHPQNNASQRLKRQSVSLGSAQCGCCLEEPPPPFAGAPPHKLLFSIYSARSPVATEEPRAQAPTPATHTHKAPPQPRHLGSQFQVPPGGSAGMHCQPMGMLL